MKLFTHKFGSPFQYSRAVGQSQPEVPDIVVGRRKVENHQLLKRTATGLSVSPELMGLSWWGPDGTPTRDYRELAWMARRVAASRA